MYVLMCVVMSLIMFNTHFGLNTTSLLTVVVLKLIRTQVDTLANKLTSQINKHIRSINKHLRAFEPGSCTFVAMRILL